MNAEQSYQTLLKATARQDYDSLKSLSEDLEQKFSHTFDELSAHPKLTQYNSGRQALFEVSILQRILQDLEPTVEMLSEARAKPHLAFELLYHSVQSGKKLDVDLETVEDIALNYLSIFVCDGHKRFTGFKVCPEPLYGRMSENTEDFVGPNDGCKDFYKKAKRVLKAYSVRRSMGRINERLKETETEPENIEDATDLSPGRILRVGPRYSWSRDALMHTLEPWNVIGPATPEEGDLYMSSCIEHDSNRFDQTRGFFVRLVNLNECGRKWKKMDLPEHIISLSTSPQRPPT